MANPNTVSLTYTANVADLKKKLASIPGATAAETRKAVQEIAKANRAVAKSAKQASAAQKRAAKNSSAAWTSSATMIATAAIAAGAAFLKLGQDVANARNALTDLSTRSGVARDTLAGLKLAAEGSGLAFSDIESIMVKLPKIMNDARRGSVEMEAAFKTLKVEFKDANGVLRDGDVVFREIVASLGKIEDPMERNAAATALFRANGTKLLQALGDPAALDAFVAMAGDSAINAEAAADSAGTWQRTMAELNLTLDSTKAVLSDGLGVEKFLTSFTLGLTTATAMFEVFSDDFAANAAKMATGFGAGALLTEMSAAGIKAAKNFHDQRDAIREATKATEKLVHVNQQLKPPESEKDRAKGIREITSALKAQTKADRAGRREMMEGINATADAEANLTTLQADLAAGSDEWAQKELAVNRQLAARVKLLDDIATQTGVTAEVDAAFLAAQEDADAQISDLRLERFEAAREGYRGLQDAARESAEEEIRYRRTVARSTVTSLADLATASGDAIVAMTEANKGATRSGMRKAWLFQRALSLAVIPLKAAEGAMVAASLPPPINALKYAEVAAVAATSAAQIAASKPPQFNDTPGVVQMQRGGLVGVAPGDMVVAGKNLDDMGSQVDRAKKAGVRSVIRRTVILPLYNGRTYDRARRDAYRRPGPDNDQANSDRANGPGGW
jgi:hypothetical protein